MPALSNVPPVPPTPAEYISILYANAHFFTLFALNRLVPHSVTQAGGSLPLCPLAFYALVLGWHILCRERVRLSPPANANGEIPGQGYSEVLQERTKAWSSSFPGKHMNVFTLDKESSKQLTFLPWFTTASSLCWTASTRVTEAGGLLPAL